MELPSRDRGAILLPPGEMTALRARLRAVAAKHDLATVIAYAFDHRTRILPFIYADLRMVPAGVRAIGSAMVDAGFAKTRIVLQQWNRQFRPSEMRLDGRIPDLFLVSSMHLHSSECDRLIQDACRLDPARRPLIVVGGPRMIYEPWQAFSDDPNQPWGADVAVTGEEFVWLSLLEVLLSLRSGKESLRSVFLRARDSGALDSIPGLVYGRSTTPNGPVEELVDTGIQQLLGDLDELPHASLGYHLLEAPSRRSTLAPAALPANRVSKHCKVSSIVLTVGCKFRCSYCPIPAYNQRQHRVKSGERIANEMEQISSTFGITSYFGTDDNFFNTTDRTLDIAETLARKAGEGKRPFCKIRYGTEATVHDTLRLQEHLPLIRRSGMLAVWMGVEDLTGTLVKKGQSESKTLEAFRLLQQNGIAPIPMMMHHDSQPLVTWKSNYGLINQLRTLRQAGALYTQVLMLTPSPGSKWYEDTYTSGLAFDSVDGQRIEPHIVDGNYVVASKHPRPWVKQLNLLIAYTYFFNPVRMAWAVVRPMSKFSQLDVENRPAEEVKQYGLLRKIRRRVYLKARVHLLDAMVQMVGMLGLLQTYRRTLKWTWHLFRGKVKHSSAGPASRLPMRSPSGQPASHALPGTPRIDELSSGTTGSLPIVRLANPSDTDLNDRRCA
ncbi:MAG TPA: radical SAM protein [Pirellulaceae bacterium]|nr:radical SAM protein [Pirellulaceae bacterium]